MDEIVRRIQEKLLQRGNAERQRAEEWQRSLKPTLYRGNNLFQELGGEPLEGRYLGQVGLVPGQSVPNIGRNPNKPVIPGLPIETTPTQEESGAIKRLFYNGIFTIDSPLDDTDFTELQMLNRVENRAPGDSTVDPWTSPFDYYSELHQTTFYYFNDKDSIQELFTHRNSQRLYRGTKTIPASDPIEWETIYSVANQGNVICDYAQLRYQHSYFTIYFTNSLDLDIDYLVNFRVVNKNGNTSGITDGFATTTRYAKSGLKISVAQGAIVGGSSSDLQFQILRDTGQINTLEIEVRLVKSFDGYITTTEKGTTFAFYGCGNESYPPYNKRFTGNGANPSQLTETADPLLNIPSWDWRQGLSTGTAPTTVPNVVYRFDYSSAFNLSTKKGYLCYKEVFIRGTDYPNLLTETTSMTLEETQVNEYNTINGVVSQTYTGKVITSNLAPIGITIDNSQDFCIPNKWNDDTQVRTTDHFPYLQFIEITYYF